MLVTLLIVSGALLSSCTAVSNCPRILYQLAQDQYLAPVFGVVSRRGVFGPGLCLTLLLSWVCLIWGNIDRIVMITGTGYLISMIAFHGGMWLQRHHPQSLWPRWSLGFLIIEVAALVVGGLLWSWQDLLVGLSLPWGMMALSRVIAHSSWSYCQPKGWRRYYAHQEMMSDRDFLVTQVVSLLFIICLTTTLGWKARSFLGNSYPQGEYSLLILVLLVVAFLGIAIASWTSLPQVIAVNEAREVAEFSQQKLSIKTQELEQTLEQLRNAQLQITQSEKMSALGGLVAGVAHEINNPVGCIVGNVSAAQDYIQDLLAIIDLYNQKFPQPGKDIENYLEDVDLDYVREDLPKLIRAMKDGGERITSISKSLRTFSRSDTNTKQLFNLHEGIDSTVLILRHRLRADSQHAAIEVIKNYGSLPEVACFPGQLNQVFMNLLANAIDALEESNQALNSQDMGAKDNRITITTALSPNPARREVVITIADNGTGMTEEVKSQIFDHLFTTKAIGKGTGLGLAIARQIVEEKHGGRLEVQSELGQGTQFSIYLPIEG